MEVVDLATKLGGNDQGHKRSDLEKSAGEVVHGGDAKRLREGNDDHRSAMEMDEEEGEEEDKGPYHSFEMYRKNWLMGYGETDPDSFDAETEYPAMNYTNVPVLPISAGPGDTMEVFFVKVAEITGGFQWPLDVYGIVAVRESLDNKRNYLFCRGRDNCQTLTSPQDSHLELTGPSRAILLWDEPVFEIDLKVKGEGGSSSEDKILFLNYFAYNNGAYRGDVSYTRTEVVSCVHSTVEVKFGHLKRSVEATILTHITKGSGNFSARLTACTSSMGEELVLLNSRGHAVSIAENGEVTLQRRVVVVEEQTELILHMKAEQLGDTATLDKKMRFRARSALKNRGYFHIGSSSLQVLVAWSLLT